MDWTNNSLVLSSVTTFIHGAEIHIELDQINMVQKGNIINLLSVSNGELNMTKISMNHS